MHQMASTKDRSGSAPIGGIWNYLGALARLGGDGLGCNLRYLRNDWRCGRWVNLRTSSERLIALGTNLHPELAHSLEKFKERCSGKEIEGRVRWIAQIGSLDFFLPKVDLKNTQCSKKFHFKFRIYQFYC